MRCSARSVVYRARGKQVSQSAEFGAVTCAMATRSMPDIDFGHPRPHIANAALRARGDCTGCVTLTEYLIKGLIHTIIPPGNVDFRRIKVHWKTIGVQTSASGIDPVESLQHIFFPVANALRLWCYVWRKNRMWPAGMISLSLLPKLVKWIIKRESAICTSCVELVHQQYKQQTFD